MPQKLREWMDGVTSWLDRVPPRRLMGILFLLALGLRVLVTLAIYWTSVWAGRQGFVALHVDPQTYDTIGWVVAQNLRAGRLIDLRPILGTGDVFYYYVLGCLYAIVGHAPLIARLLNAVAGAVVPLLVLLIGNEAFSERIARRAALFMAVFPNAIYWSGYDLIKDPLLWVVFLLALYSALLVSGGSWRAAASFPFLVAALRIGRGTMGLLVMGTVVIFFVAEAWSRETVRKQMIMAVAVFAVLEVGLSGGIPIQKWISSQYAGGAQVARAMSAAEQDLGPEDLPIVWADPGAVVVAWATALGKFTFGPFAWVLMPTFTYEMLLYPGMWIWYGMLPFAFVGAARALGRSTTCQLLLLAIAVEVVFGWGVLMGGGGFRQRETLTPLFALFAFAGAIPRPRRCGIVLWWVFVGLFAVAQTLARSV